MKLPFIFARRFVAGRTATEALPVVERFNRSQIHVTLDLLGEEVTQKRVAAGTIDRYIELMRLIESEGLQSTISVKLSMMGLLINETFCRDNLFRLLDEAARLEQFVRIDMEGSDYTQAILDLFYEAMNHYRDQTGIVIQAYLHRSREDIPRLARMGADVRLCKGAYKEPPEIALQRMPDIRKAFMSYARELMTHTRFPRIATHDDLLINRVRQWTDEQKIPKTRFEYQMLYGLREETLKTLAQSGYRTRVYVPFGTEWLPYFYRRLTERRENILFVLSNLFRK